MRASKLSRRSIDFSSNSTATIPEDKRLARIWIKLTYTLLRRIGCFFSIQHPRASRLHLSMTSNPDQPPQKLEERSKTMSTKCTTVLLLAMCLKLVAGTFMKSCDSSNWALLVPTQNIVQARCATHRGLWRTSILDLGFCYTNNNGQLQERNL